MGNEVLTTRTLGGLQVTKVQERSPWLNMGISGESGVGKTVLAGSASEVPEMSPVINIDLENGAESLRRTYPNVDVVRVKNIAELQDVYNELYHSTTHGYRTVMLDSATELQAFDMMGIMSEKVELKPDADPDLPEWQQYGKSLVRMRAMIRGFRDLELHTIITSLSMDNKDNKTGLTTVTPKFTGQFAKEYPALLDVILYYYTKEWENPETEQVENGRFLLSSKTEKIVAKDRTNTLPTVLTNPTMQKIYDFMKTADVPLERYESPVEPPTVDESEMPSGVSDEPISESSNDDSNLQIQI